MRALLMLLISVGLPFGGPESARERVAARRGCGGVPSWRGWVLVACLSQVLAGSAWGFTFVPTTAEWNAWPAYCRAKYSSLSLDMVFNSGYYGRVSPQEVARTKAELGKAWDGVHHHCAGLSNFQRAVAASQEGQRKSLLKQAYGDTQYSLVRIDQTNVLYAPMSVQMGLVARAQGNWARAMQHFDAAIAARPDLPDGYQGVAMIHRDRRDLEAARDILVRGNEAVGGGSAEIHYTLGLVLFDMKQYEAAAEHARRAYDLGYPLPGLRRKLATAGVTVD